MNNRNGLFKNITPFRLYLAVVLSITNNFIIKNNLLNNY